MKTKIRRLTVLITMGLVGSHTVFAAPPSGPEDCYKLPDVTVTAVRNMKIGNDGREVLPGGFQGKAIGFGLFGDQNIMHVPYSVQSISEKAMATFVTPDENMSQALANVPSLRTGSSLIKTDFSARGMLANGSAMYLNNIPGFFIMAAGPVTNSIGRVDVLVGPAATLSGSVQSYNGPDGGQPVSVYLYTKMPEKKDFTHYTQTFGGYGHYGEYLDINRSHLGPDGSFGIRAYAEYSDGGLAISGAARRKKNIFVDVSHEDIHSKTNFFGGYYEDYLNGTERRFQMDPLMNAIPGAPNSGKSYDDPHLMHSNWNGYMLTLNHEQQINPDTKWFFNAGMNDMTNRRFIYWSQISINQLGDLKNNRVWSQYFYTKSRYGQMGLKTKFRTGMAEHNLILAVDRSWRVQYNNTRRDKNNQHVTGNIYSGIQYHPSIYAYDISDRLGQKFQYQEMDTSLNLMDNIKLGKWTLMAAMTRRHGNYRGNGSNNQITDNQWSPTYGINYAPADCVSVYGTYARATTRGQIVSGGYANEGELLPAVKVTQKEIGVKYNTDNLYASLAYFDMLQPAYLDVANPADASLPFYYLDGANRFRGIDCNVTGKISKKWNAFGGFEYLYARQQNTYGGQNDGLPTDSSADWSAVLGLEYMPSVNWSITARMNYVGEGTVIGSHRRELTVPSSTVFDLFVKYKTKMGSTPVMVQASCYNLFNHNYWVLQPGQEGKLLLSSPRTFTISATFEL